MDLPLFHESGQTALAMDELPVVLSLLVSLWAWVIPLCLAAWVRAPFQPPPQQRLDPLYVASFGHTTAGPAGRVARRRENAKVLMGSL